MMVGEEDFLAAVRIATREEERFFSNAAKPERELWIAREFLNSLRVSFVEAELTATPQYNDADVLFRDARFQIKEIPELGIRRNAELKASRTRAESATRIEDLIQPTEAHDIVISNAYLLMLEKASAQRYAPAVKANLDLLYYVTRAYSGMGSEEERRRLGRTGWRSISCLYGSRAMVVFATARAPSILKHRRRRLTPRPADGYRSSSSFLP